MAGSWFYGRLSPYASILALIYSMRMEFNVYVRFQKNGGISMCFAFLIRICS